MRLLLLLLGLAATAAAAVYEVGPGKALESIGQAPWTALQPGDTVLIHWREEPYREKWVICRRGEPESPITVRGVPGPEGQLPVIDGRDAVTPAPLNFWNEVRSVLKIGGANTPSDTTPAWIVVEGLDIRSGRPPYRFTDRYGAIQTYAANGASIHIEKGEFIVIRNCRLHDSGNGLFIGSAADNPTRDVLIDGNYVWDNGNEGSIYEHNSYTEALGLTFQFNRYGPLRSGASGNNLKDRSAGLTLRCNWIEGGNRQLDLVDAGPGLVRSDERYRTTHVYGNILIEPAGAGNRQIVHYGGDSAASDGYRKGTLHFYHNTVVSTRTDRTTLLRLSTNEETCEASNNIFYVSAPGNTLSLLDSSGLLTLRRNWIKPGWVRSFGEFGGRVEGAQALMEAADPAFRAEAEQDFTPAEHSICRTAAEPLPQTLPAVLWQYRVHQGMTDRPVAADLGALEGGSSPSSTPASDLP